MVTDLCFQFRLKFKDFTGYSGISGQIISLQLVGHSVSESVASAAGRDLLAGGKSASTLAMLT